MIFSGLPFTSRAKTEGDVYSSISLSVEYTASSIDTGTFGRIADEATTMAIRENGLTTTGEDVAPHFDTGTYVAISGFYFSA